MNNRNPIAIGAAGGIGLVALYLSILSLVSYEHALERFLDMWSWIVVLAVGFGVQLGLYAFIRRAMAERRSRGAVTMSGGVSAGSMIACCAHHLGDILPALGLSAAAAFLTKYQVPLMSAGVFSNVVGIIVMLKTLKENELIDPTGVFGRLFGVDMVKLRNTAVVLGVLAVSYSFLSIYETPAAAGPAGGSANGGQSAAEGGDEQAGALPTRTNTEGSVAFSVTPSVLTGGRAVFDVSIDTHSGSLDFDLVEAALLVDENGQTYKPTAWDGDPAGGHHRSGTLKFDGLGEDVKSVKLIVKNVDNVAERIFEWRIN